MPYLNIQTNLVVEQNDATPLLKKVSQSVAEMLGKPESYVMIALEANTPMVFGGSDAPLAYLELKSLGLPEEKTAQFSAALCELIGNELGIEQNRIYIEFANPARHMFGWDGRTF